MARAVSVEAGKYSIAPASDILLKILDTSAVIGNVGHVSLRACAGAKQQIVFWLQQLGVQI